MFNKWPKIMSTRLIWLLLYKKINKDHLYALCAIIKKYIQCFRSKYKEKRINAFSVDPQMEERGVPFMKPNLNLTNNFDEK